MKRDRELENNSLQMFSNTAKKILTGTRINFRIW